MSTSQKPDCEKAKNNLEQAETDLREVKAGYQPLNVVQTEINFKNTKLDDALKNYQQLQTEMEDKQRQLSHLDGLLRSLVSQENKTSSQKELGEYQLQSEELNPVYQELTAKISNLQIQIDTYDKRKIYLLSEVPALLETSRQVNTKRIP